ncbi:MAG: class II aldolase/adducin family protein [Bacteroidota bacterium]|nr:class II aldolase/adducin family protein [Bacteroidota bacterium]
MSNTASVRDQLLALAAELGDPRQMAILGEGNVSGNVDADTFLVKASGTSLQRLKPGDLVRVRRHLLLEALAADTAIDDAHAERLLLSCRIRTAALKPSVETLFHAWLLSLPGISFVGHVHAIAINAIMCSPLAEEFAYRRIMPDQVVYCGVRSVLIPYVDPGIQLARRIAREVEKFIRTEGGPPRLILLMNHGIIAIGSHAREVSAALSMAEKAARVFIDAMAMGGPVYMPKSQVRRIAGRKDEHYRQKMLREGHAGK